MNLWETRSQQRVDGGWRVDLGKYFRVLGIWSQNVCKQQYLVNINSSLTQSSLTNGRIIETENFNDLIIMSSVQKIDK